MLKVLPYALGIIVIILLAIAIIDYWIPFPVFALTMKYYILLSYKYFRCDAFIAWGVSHLLHITYILTPFLQ